MAPMLHLPSWQTGPVLPEMTSTGNRERGTLAGVFYLAGSGVAGVAILDPLAHTEWQLVVAAAALVVALVSLVARRYYTYAATVTSSFLGPALIAIAVVAGAGGWSSSLAAGLYTFVAVHTALVLHWRHATAVMVWAAATAVGAAHLVAAPLPPALVAVVFVLGCGTLSLVTLWLVAEVRRRASIDPLTSVANRSVFQAALAHAVATVARTGEPLALVAMDLDGFRLVNNTLGHAAGDRLLVEATQAWQPELRARDTLARVGGDEFSVVLPGADADQARAVARRLESVMPAGATCSTGVAVWEPGQSVPQLCAAADRELYASKARRGESALPGPASPRLAPA